jgi:hypothetical protein
MKWMWVKMDFMQLKKVVAFRQMIADSTIKQQLDGKMEAGLGAGSNFWASKRTQ